MLDNRIFPELWYPWSSRMDRRVGTAAVGTFYPAYPPPCTHRSNTHYYQKRWCLCAGFRDRGHKDRTARFLEGVKVPMAQGGG